MARLVPRFYFNLCDGAEFVKDDEGIELSDYAAARRKAVEGLRGVMAGDLLTGDLNTASFIEIEDESHELIELVSFADVVRMRDEPHIRLDEQPSVGRARNRHIRGLD
jgi:hypothetical protein